MAIKDESKSPNTLLLTEVQNRVESLDRETCEEWGGVWENGTCHVQETVSSDYNVHTQVNSPLTARHAFEKYTEWFEYVLDEHEPQSDSCVLLPCGANKPIGSSAIHQKKVKALKETGFYPDSDIIIISEPCTVVPHNMRLHAAPVNYDFPPEYTEHDVAPRVFETFTDRIARFIDEMPYNTYYPYLVKGHQEKFDTALEKAGSSPRVVEIPGSSLGLESHALSGDLFKSLDDITTKLEFVRAYADEGDSSLVSHHDSDVQEFYANRSEYELVR